MIFPQYIIENDDDKVDNDNHDDDDDTRSSTDVHCQQNKYYNQIISWL